MERAFMEALALFMELRNDDSCCAIKASWLRCDGGHELFVLLAEHVVAGLFLPNESPNLLSFCCAKVCCTRWSHVILVWCTHEIVAVDKLRQRIELALGSTQHIHVRRASTAGHGAGLVAHPAFHIGAQTLLDDEGSVEGFDADGVGIRRAVDVRADPSHVLRDAIHATLIRGRDRHGPHHVQAARGDHLFVMLKEFLGGQGVTEVQAPVEASSSASWDERSS